MTRTEQLSLILFGESIDILVSPVMIDDEPGVHYTDNATKDYARAYADLVALSLQVCKCAA